MRATLFLLGFVAFVPALAAAGENPLADLAARASGNAATLVELGDLQVEAMLLDDAKRTYREALKIDKTNGEAAFGLVRIDMALRKFNPAKTACRQIARQHKDTAVGEVCSGWFWLSNERSARAVDEFTKAIAKGDNARGKEGMGESLRLRGDFDGAIAVYKEAIAAGASYRAHLGLGLALELKGDKAGAIAAFKEAATRQPASCLARYNLGRLEGSGPEAVSELKTALAIRPGWVDAYIALGDTYENDGEHAKAAEAYQAAIGGEQGRGAAFFGLGRAQRGLGKNDEALKSLAKAIELIPNHVGAYLLLADIKYEAGATEEALQALENARTAAPGDVSVYLNSGDVYFRLGRHTSARSFLNQAITMKPDLSRAHALLGDIACSRRLYDEGRASYDAALKGDLAGVDAKQIEQKKAACKPKR